MKQIIISLLFITIAGLYGAYIGHTSSKPTINVTSCSAIIPIVEKQYVQLNDYQRTDLLQPSGLNVYTQRFPTSRIKWICGHKPPLPLKSLDIKYFKEWAKELKCRKLETPIEEYCLKYPCSSNDIR